MSVVNVAELKSRLSYYLGRVRRGESVLVRNRDRIVARLEPVGSETTRGEDALAALEQAGTLRRGRGAIDRRLFAGRVRCAGDVVAALIDERQDGR